MAGNANAVLSNNGTVAVWQSFGGDLAGSPSVSYVTGLQGRQVGTSAPDDQDGLRWNAASAKWEPARVVDGGLGVTLLGAELSVDDAVVPFYSSGQGAPAYMCTAGRDIYVDTLGSKLYFCPQAGQWVSGAALAGANNFTGANDFSAAASTKPAKAGITLPLSCSQGEVFYKNDTLPGQNLFFCTATNTWSQMSGGNASLNRTVVGPEWDEFWPTGISSLALGKFGWLVAGTASNLAGETGHPGILQLATAASVNGSSHVALSGSGSVRPVPRLDSDTNWEYNWIFKTPASLSEVKIRLGFSASTSYTESAPPGAYLRYSSSTGCTSNLSDTNWVYTSADGTASTTAAGPSIATNTWYTFRVRSTTSGTLLYSVATDTGPFSTEQSLSTNVYAGSVIPFAQVIGCDGAAKQLQIDAWGYYLTGVAR